MWEFNAVSPQMIITICTDFLVYNKGNYHKFRHTIFQNSSNVKVKWSLKQ